MEREVLLLLHLPAGATLLVLAPAGAGWVKNDASVAHRKADYFKEAMELPGPKAVTFCGHHATVITTTRH